MDTRKYLNQIRRYEKIINNRLEEIEHLKSLATSISISAYGVERVQTSGTHDKIGDTIARIVDDQKEIAKIILDYRDKKQEIIALIESVEDTNYYDLLFKRYVEGKKLQVIADEMGYSIGAIKRFHLAALESVRKMKNFES